MKFFRFAITVLAAATSSSCFVSATAAAAAASRKRKITKKVGATGQTDGDVIPIGGLCDAHFNDNCMIPPGLEHGVCLVACPNGQPGSPCKQTYCQNGQPGAACGVTDDCVVQTDLDPPHAVCRHNKCQR